MSLTNAPDTLPPLKLSMLCNMKMSGMKALTAVLTACKGGGFPPSSLPLLLRDLTASSLSPVQTSSLPIDKIEASESIAIESAHPYSNNCNEYSTIYLKGASRLIIYFDERSATENGSDFVRFYKDSSHTDFYGEAFYSGGKDGSPSNWPVSVIILDNYDIFPYRRLFVGSERKSAASDPFERLCSPLALG
jgi:hypothetical protein